MINTMRTCEVTAYNAASVAIIIHFATLSAQPHTIWRKRDGCMIDVLRIAVAPIQYIIEPGALCSGCCCCVLRMRVRNKCITQTHIHQLILHGAIIQHPPPFVFTRSKCACFEIAAHTLCQLMIVCDDGAWQCRWRPGTFALIGGLCVVGKRVCNL